MLNTLLFNFLQMARMSAVVLGLVLAVGMVDAVKLKESGRSQTSKSFLKDLFAKAVPAQDMIFKTVDKDKDGFISLSDLAKVTGQDGAEALIKHADLNKDGKLTRLEFFGTYLGGPKEAGKPGSGEKDWANRNFDKMLDTPNGKGWMPDLCSEAFWSNAADEWRQRKQVNSDIPNEKAGFDEFFLNGNHEKENMNPENYLQHRNRQLSIPGAAMWDVCANVLDMQVALDLMTKYPAWRACMMGELAGLTYAQGMTILPGTPFTGIPFSAANGEAVATFIDDYYVKPYKYECGPLYSDKDGE